MAREYVGFFNPDLLGKFHADAVRSCLPGAPTNSPSLARDCRTALCLLSPWRPAVPVSFRPHVRRALGRVRDVATTLSAALRSPPPHWAQVMVLRVLLLAGRAPRARPLPWACARPLQAGAPFPRGFDPPRRGILR